MDPLFGVFVGGQGRRMGGVAKGNLQIEGQTLLARTQQLCAGVVPQPRVLVVGESAAYQLPDAQRLADSPPNIGPLGGLRALLLAAQSEGRAAVALAVDMPYWQPELLKRLLAAPAAAAVAPRQQGFWQPLFARYDPGPALGAVEAALEQGRRSLQSVFEALGPAAVELSLTETERSSLDDWDRPLDLLSKR